MGFRLAALAAGLVLFAVLHSLLAATGVRTRLEKVLGVRTYRLAYNLFAAGWAYAYAGAWIEERKLAARFGDSYRRYCATTPRLLPRLPRRRRVVDSNARQEPEVR